jgi:hypothetical protein
MSTYTREQRAAFLERLAAWHSGTAAIERDDTIQQFHADATRVVRDVIDEHASLLDALVAIEDGDSDCGCSHDTPDCCAAVDAYCPRCIAAAAIAKAEGR